MQNIKNSGLQNRANKNKQGHEKLCIPIIIYIFFSLKKKKENSCFCNHEFVII